VCPMQTLHRGLSGHQKQHCSGAFWSHDMIYGLSEALWTLSISLECFKAEILCIESRYLVCTLILDIHVHGLRPKKQKCDKVYVPT
jgi:hypothetical protein